MALLRRDDTVQDATGRALAGAQVYYLSQPANVGTLSPLAAVYSNNTGTVEANPQITDGFGHAVAYLADGSLYTVVYVHPLIGEIIYFDQSVGSSGSAPNVFTQVPAGAVNGVNNVFTLSVTPTLLFFYWNGVFQTPGFDYTISGSTITMANVPKTGDALYAQGNF